jgi:ATP-dependent helicase/nuclease subunit B
LTPLAIRRLETEAAAGMSIEVLVAAEEEILEPGFDRWGQPREDYWAKHVLDTDGFEERLHVRRDSGRQASVVAELLAQSTLGSVSVGLIDPSLERLLVSRLAANGVAVYNPDGETLAGHRVVVLIRSLIGLLVEPSSSNAGELLRCPDILMAIAERWRKRQEEDATESSEAREFDEAKLLRAWDLLRQDHLPGTLAELHAALKRVRASEDERDRWGKTGSEINEAVWFLEEVVRAFEHKPVSEALEDFLKAVYGWRTFDRDAEETQALLEPLTEVRLAVETVLTFMADGDRKLRSVDVLGMALEHVAALRHYEASPDDPEVVPLQGWLELLWEDKPHLVLAGFNEGKVPESITSHAFLPESLREMLGLSTNAQRYARDAYLLWAIQAGRRPENGGRVDIVQGQTSATGDPLRPSRLLLQCENSALPKRVAHLFAEDRDEQAQVPWQAAWRLAEHPLSIPEDWEERLSRGLSVTAIRDYLACPFRFYLTHVLRMQPADPFKMELDARDFGNLIHAAMEVFGSDPEMVASIDVDDIADFLDQQVDRWMGARYGTALSVPMRQQQDAAKARLAKVARVQALARQQGWRITEVELKMHEALDGFEVSGLPLRGVIDRIESQGDDAGGPWRVVDYKTTDSPVYNPDRETRYAHFRSVPRQGCPSHVRDYACFDYDPDGNGARACYWVDLQLPLYCLAMQHGRGVQPSWAHFCVSKKLEDIKIYEELWDDTLMDAALRCAEGVVADVRSGRFLPASEKVTFENYERLILGRPLETIGTANGR